MRELLRIFATSFASLTIATAGACTDPKANATDAAVEIALDAAAVPVVKNLDAAKCASASADLEALAKAAPKTCTQSADCTEWIRKGNCGSVALARPFPQPEVQAKWSASLATVSATCPDEPKCKWASMGVECRGGKCVPSLDGVLMPDAAP